MRVSRFLSGRQGWLKAECARERQFWRTICLGAFCAWHRARRCRYSTAAGQEWPGESTGGRQSARSGCAWTACSAWLAGVAAQGTSWPGHVTRGRAQRLGDSKSSRAWASATLHPCLPSAAEVQTQGGTGRQGRQAQLQQIAVRPPCEQVGASVIPVVQCASGLGAPGLQNLPL